MPFDYFAEKATQIKEFLRHRRKVKIRMIMVVLWNNNIWKKEKLLLLKNKAYFNTETYINLESTDVKTILSQMIKEIFRKNLYLSKKWFRLVFQRSIQP